MTDDAISIVFPVTFSFLAFILNKSLASKSIDFDLSFTESLPPDVVLVSIEKIGKEALSACI